MISMTMQFIIINLKKISNQFIFNARIKTVHGLMKNPIKFFLFKQIYFFDIIRLLILSNFNNLDMKLSFGNQKYIPYFLRIITIMENQYVFFK